MEQIIHTTREGDRWDLLAWEYYGDATLLEPLWSANPDMPRDTRLPAGQRLVVPVLDAQEPTPALGLPPWR